MKLLLANNLGPSLFFKINIAIQCQPFTTYATNFEASASNFYGFPNKHMPFVSIDHRFWITLFQSPCITQIITFLGGVGEGGLGTLKLKTLMILLYQVLRRDTFELLQLHYNTLRGHDRLSPLYARIQRDQEFLRMVFLCCSF